MTRVAPEPRDAHDADAHAGPSGPPTSTPKPTLDAAFADELVAQGVRHAFALPGAPIYPLLDAIAERTGIVLHCFPHEQQLVHAAEGYAHDTGTPAVVIVTAGPGFTNTLTGLADALHDRRPIVLIAGDLASHLRGTGAFQDLGTLTLPEGIVRHAHAPRSSQAAIESLSSAFDEAMGRTSADAIGPLGPSVVVVPTDLWSKEVVRTETPPASETNDAPTEAWDAAHADAVGAWAKADRRAIVLGAGVRRDADFQQIVRLAETLHVPIASSMTSLGGVATTHPLSMGMPGIYGTRRANLAVAQADAILALGSRLNDRLTGPADAFTDRRVVVANTTDVCGTVSDRVAVVPLDVAEIVGAALGASSGEGDRAWSDGLVSLPRAEPRDLELDGDRPLSAHAAIELVTAACGPDDRLVADCGNHQVVTAHRARLSRLGQFLTTGGFGTMGFAIPAAIGRALASDGPVLCIVGDGGTSASLSALEPLGDLGLSVRILVVNDAHYGMVGDVQRARYQGRSVLAQRPRTDFAGVARALGIEARTVRSPDELRAALGAMPDRGPVLIDAHIAGDATPRPVWRHGSPLDDFVE